MKSKEPIRWPRMNETVKWANLEEVVSKQLPNIPMYLGKKVCMLETILYEEAKAMF